MTIKKRLTVSNIIMITAPITAVLLVGAVCLGVLYFAMNRSNGMGFSDSREFYSSMQTISDKMYEVFEHSKEERINRLNILSTLIDRNSMYMLVYENGEFFYESGNAELKNDELLSAANKIGEKSFVSDDKSQLYYYTTVEGADRYDLYLFNTVSHTDNSMIKTVLIVSAVVIIIAVLLTIALTNRFLSKFVLKRIEQPLDILSHGVDEISRGNLEYRLDYNENDEFTPVCRDFNFMAQTLKRSVDLARKNEENRKELLLGISHDLRSPLTSIQAYVEGLMTGVANTPEMQEKYLSTIKRKTIDIERMVSSLLAYSKLDMEVFNADIVNTDMSKFMCSFVSSAYDEYYAKGLDVRVEGEDGINANIDEELFIRITTNLFDNSLKYKTKERGECAVKISRKENGRCEVEFADDGPGVKAQYLPKLFDIFYRTDSARNNPGSGSGIGLAFVKKAVQTMGGDIRAEINELGGLSVIIDLEG